MQTKHRQSFDDNIISEFNKARQIMKSLPSRFPFFIQALINQKAASFRRQSQARHGLEVPPLLIISITKRCMLNCKGCYSKLIHTSDEAELNVEPCPFAPFSDSDLRYGSLRDALESRFLREIRENHHLLKEGEGGCALWSNRDWVKRLCLVNSE